MTGPPPTPPDVGGGLAPPPTGGGGGAAPPGPLENPAAAGAPAADRGFFTRRARRQGDCGPPQAARTSGSNRPGVSLAPGRGRWRRATVGGIRGPLPRI